MPQNTYSPLSGPHFALAVESLHGAHERDDARSFEEITRALLRYVTSLPKHSWIARSILLQLSLRGETDVAEKIRTGKAST